MTLRRRLGLLPLLVSLFCCCSSEKPLTREEIFSARAAVPTLYVTESGEQVVAPGVQDGAIVHNGEIAWEAFTCKNPDCPGEGKNGHPFVFPRVHPFGEISPEGTFRFGLPQSQEDVDKITEYAEIKCPACLSKRNLKTETAEQKQQYQAWCVQYVLPEATERLKELDDAYQEMLKRHQKPPVN